MIAKLALAGLVPLSLLPLPDSEFPPTITTEPPYIEKVTCLYGSGTAFKIADGKWITVAHVADNIGCQIDGIYVTTIYADKVGDFAILAVPGENRKGGIGVNCNGFVDRQWYYAIGHGRGRPSPQVVAVRYSAALTWIGSTRWAILEGNRFVPGMSGGPVLDQTGRVVGTINAYGIYQRISFSRQLKDTAICAR